MAALLRIGRLGWIKLLQEECWATLRAPAAAAYSSKSGGPKKNKKNNNKNQPKTYFDIEKLVQHTPYEVPKIQVSHVTTTTAGVSTKPILEPTPAAEVPPESQPQTSVAITGTEVTAHDSQFVESTIEVVYDPEPVVSETVDTEAPIVEEAVIEPPQVSEPCVEPSPVVEAAEILEKAAESVVESVSEVVTEAAPVVEAVSEVVVEATPVVEAVAAAAVPSVQAIAQAVKKGAHVVDNVVETIAESVVESKTKAPDLAEVAETQATPEAPGIESGAAPELLGEVKETTASVQSETISEPPTETKEPLVPEETPRSAETILEVKEPQGEVTENSIVKSTVIETEATPAAIAQKQSSVTEQVAEKADSAHLDSSVAQEVPSEIREASEEAISGTEANKHIVDFAPAVGVTKELSDSEPVVSEATVEHLPLEPLEAPGDPVQKLFLDAIQSYLYQSKTFGGLVEGGPEYEKALVDEIAKLQRLYGGGDLTSFPTFTFPEPKFD